ncbi:hypothetical protein B0H11DRAFT_2278876 [Mycena galericulata]|nr:hypothetical protein B0H11DRAFT_2278876 [Mycena galericulata]
MPTWIIYAASPHDSDIPARHAAVDTFVVERTSSFSHAGETFPRLPDPPHSCQRFPGHVRAHGSSTTTPRSFSPAQRATLPVPTHIRGAAGGKWEETDVEEALLKQHAKKGDTGLPSYTSGCSASCLRAAPNLRTPSSNPLNASRRAAEGGIPLMDFEDDGSYLDGTVGTQGLSITSHIPRSRSSPHPRHRLRHPRWRPRPPGYPAAEVDAVTEIDLPRPGIE